MINDEHDITELVTQYSGPFGDFYQRYGLDMKVDYVIPTNFKEDFEMDNAPTAEPYVFAMHPDMDDIDADGIADGCDDLIDSDGDGISDYDDACHGHDDSIDIDADGIADGCDALIDVDGDGVSDENDICPDTPDYEISFLNGCSFSQIDTDGDSVMDADDAFPLDSTETVDTDGDGIGNNADTDDDGDGVDDGTDAFDSAANESADADGDGVGDNADDFPNAANETTDFDGDGVGDNNDDLHYAPSETTDSDGDGIPDVSEGGGDSDSDGTPDFLDAVVVGVRGRGRTCIEVPGDFLGTKCLIVDAELIEGAVQGSIVDPGRAPQPVVYIVDFGEGRLGDRVGRLLYAITPVIDFGRSISEVLDRHREVNLLTEDGHHVAVKGLSLIHI